MSKSPYDIETFFSFDDYERISRQQPVKLTAYDEFKFDFYEMKFENGASIYLFPTALEAVKFKNCMSFPKERIPFIGKIEDIDNRILVESLKRNNADFYSLCNQLAEDKKFMFIYVPFLMSWQETADNI